MKLSTRGRYACRAMIELARHHGEGSLSIDRIAEKQHISKRYLEHIFARLREAGIISGTRGSKGGYVLLRPPEAVSVGEIVRAVEGPLGPVHCVDNPNSCPKVGHCATHDLWMEAAEALNALLDSHTVASLMNQQKALDDAPRTKDTAGGAVDTT
jgi:Rrf2 family protein